MGQAASLDLAGQLIRADFKLRYQGSRLGYLWALLGPLASFLVLFVVFSHIFTRAIPHYPLHLFSGLVLWNFFAEGTQVGLQALVSKTQLLSRVALSQRLVVIAATGQALITFGFTSSILAIFFWLLAVPITLPSVIAYGLFAVAVYLIIIGVSLLLAPLQVRYRDIGHIWSVLLRVGFFASPIIYAVTSLPPLYQRWLWLNPVGYSIYHLRQTLLHGEPFAWEAFSFVFTLALAVLLLGQLISSALERQTAELL